MDLGRLATLRKILSSRQKVHSFFFLPFPASPSPFTPSPDNSKMGARFIGALGIVQGEKASRARERATKNAPSPTVLLAWQWPPKNSPPLFVADKKSAAYVRYIKLPLGSPSSTPRPLST